MSKIKLDDVKIESIIREEINKLITEEKSIADEVKRIADIILIDLLNGKFNFQLDLYDLGEFNVVGTPTEVASLDTKVNGVTDFKNNVINLNIPIFKGNIVKKTLSEEVYHEVEHIFQVSNLKNTDNGTNKSYNTLYNIAIKQVENPNINYYQRELARYIYCCSTMEQDAFVNALYSDFMNCHITNNNEEVDVLKNSQAYKALNTIRDVRNEIMKGDGSFGYVEAAKDYNKKIRWFVQLGDNAEARLKQKIKNVILKARKDKLDNILFHNINLDGVGR